MRHREAPAVGNKLLLVTRDRRGTWCYLGSHVLTKHMNVPEPTSPEPGDGEADTQMGLQTMAKTHFCLKRKRRANSALSSDHLEALNVTAETSLSPKPLQRSCDGHVSLPMFMEKSLAVRGIEHELSNALLAGSG